MTRTHVSLFSGIGGWSIAAEQHSYTTTHHVEIDPFCQRILRKRFPDATVRGDIAGVRAAEMWFQPDLMTISAPCQGLSSAGLGAGLADPRSALWFEGLRLIRETRPKLVLIENVAALRSRGLDVVVRGLADAGYGCWWDCVPALAVGAPHLRDRIWITAVPFESFPHYALVAMAPDRRAQLDRDGKMSRAGWARPVKMLAGGRRTYAWHTAWYAWHTAPQATIRMCKEAAGAVKRADGVTWLTKLGTPLWPTPSASSYGSNRGGAAGRVRPIRHSLASMARSGEWPDAPCFPTPTVGGSRNSRNATAGRTPGSKGHSGTTLSDFTRLWRTPTSHPRTHTPRPVHHGRQPANEVASEALRLWPTPSRADGTGGPGRSPKRTGGDNLRTAAAPGSLNPDWVEALMLLPVAFTDPDCDHPEPVDWTHGEPPIPRVAAGVEHRRDRLCAIGNALVPAVASARLAQAHRLLGVELS